VEADEYRGGVLFRGVRAGAFFYVLPNAVAAAHEVMLRNGYKPHVGAAGVELRPSPSRESSCRSS